MGNNFQVDLGGIVQLLSHHLYSSPRVYLRELIQNGVDAITARAAAEPDTPRRIVVTPADVAGDGRLHVADSGTGLTRDGIETFLATIGRSSKRDEISRARGDLLGQFGIGLLSGFMVTDEIEVTTRAAGGPTLRWVGRADGTYRVEEAAEQRAGTGTTVSLRPHDGARDLTSHTQVRVLLREFAQFLPCEIVLETDAGPVTVTDGLPPWEDAGLTGLRRRSAAVELCHDLFGFAPLDVIELADPASGTRGYAYVLPTAAHRTAHRVYAKRMLLSENNTDLLPEWAFFVRAVLNTDRLTPTANREGLFDDEALAQARERLGLQLRQWLARLATTSPARMREFLDVHSLGVRAMASQDDDMLDTVAPWLPFESTLGTTTLEEFAAQSPVIRYCEDAQDFAQMLPIAASLGMPILNAGYAYDREIVLRLRERTGRDSIRTTPADLVGHLEEPDSATQARFADVIAVAEGVLARANVRPVLRRFDPASVAGMIFTDRSARLEAEREVTAASSDAVWAELLGAVAKPDARPWFVLNAANPTVGSLVGVDQPIAEDVVEALYAQALVLGRHPLRPFDTALITRALPALIERALRGKDDHDHTS